MSRREVSHLAIFTHKSVSSSVSVGPVEVMETFCTPHSAPSLPAGVSLTMFVCVCVCVCVPISLYITITPPNEKILTQNFQDMILGVEDLSGIFKIFKKNQGYLWDLWKISPTFRDFSDTFLLSYLLEINLIYLKYIERSSRDTSEIYQIFWDILGYINYILNHAQISQEYGWYI